MKVVNFSLENGNRYYGKIDGERFFIGQRVPYQGLKGLMNVAGSPAQKYDRAQYRAIHGFWADFMHPTAMAEGALFHTLNTYDRALFTFSFLQYAAHVPNGDFVVYLRSLLALSQARDYFPDLTLQNGRICRVTDTGVRPLESDDSTTGLQDYLNPTSQEVEDTEIVQAAKFIHWVQRDPEHRHVQVAVGVAHFKEKMKRYAVQYHLDGADDITCLLVADIRHQGRAKGPVIAAALASSNPQAALLKIGETSYPERVATLKREIKALTADGTFGRRRYHLDSGEFALN
ncbi:hypothetical protein [Tahibacter amnicola]|uniref:HIRAN domain-containing protein n=1 Tax=Tahibacter amnicola TaxID=2976241 RepID=A0ABY6BL65_9GAMM|nr:hypothetical protein [Tahibacter amnicola]UXI70509.1 hypothetical protein N4264_12985 [Tahibacter amnicola]